MDSVTQDNDNCSVQRKDSASVRTSKKMPEYPPDHCLELLSWKHRQRAASTSRETFQLLVFWRKEVAGCEVVKIPKTQVPLKLSTKLVQHFVVSSFRWLLTQQMAPTELSPFRVLRINREMFTLWAP